jgi:uncharacterized membrane protein YraQ (UPF0718 family)
MTEIQNREWKRALWTVVAAALIAIGANFWMNVQFQATVKEQIRVMQHEQHITRIKVDQMSIDLQGKVDRTVLDECLRDMNSNISTMRSSMENNFEQVNKNILDIFKNRKQ